MVRLENNIVLRLRPAAFADVRVEVVVPALAALRERERGWREQRSERERWRKVAETTEMK